MRHRSPVTLLAFALSVTLPTRAASPNDTPNSSPDPIPVFQAGADVSSPSLLPLSISLDVPKHCKGNMKGRVLLGAIIDAQGKTRNLRFLNPKDAPDVKDNPDLDKLALLVANSDRFQPAIHADSPVAVAQAIELQLTACLLTEDQGHGVKRRTVHLKAVTSQTLLPYPDPPHKVLFGESPAENEDPAHGPWQLYKSSKDGTLAPKLLRFVEASFTEDARRKRVQGTIVLSLIVDSNGLPRQIKVERSLDTGLDQNAIAAVMQYRFAPALHNDQPVAVSISVQVNYRLY